MGESHWIPDKWSQKFGGDGVMVDGGYRAAAFSRKLVSQITLVGKKLRGKKKNHSPLTDTRNQIIKSFLRKEGVFQPTEVEL